MCSLNNFGHRCIVLKKSKLQKALINQENQLKYQQRFGLRNVQRFKNEISQVATKKLAILQDWLSPRNFKKLRKLLLNHVKSIKSYE